MHDDTSHPCPCSEPAEEVRTRFVVVVDAAPLDGRAHHLNRGHRPASDAGRRGSEASPPPLGRALAPALAEKLARWAEDHPEPYRHAHWLG